MPIPSLEERRRMPAALKARRRREWFALAPAALALVVACYAAGDPETEIAGLAGLDLIVLCLAVIAGGLLLHFANWRCPNCARYLAGWRRGACRHCEAPLRESRETSPTRTTDASGLRHEQP